MKIQVLPNIIVLGIAFACFCKPVHDANAQVSFRKIIGETGFYDRCNSVRQTSDGGYIIAGRTVTFGKGGVQVYLVRTDRIGNVLWAKDYGGPGSEEGFSVEQTVDGGYIITGYTNSYGAGSRDVYLIHTDAMGEILWTKTFGGSGIDGGHSVQQTVDGGYIITGETYSFGEGWVNAYLIHTDANGEELWTEVFGGNGIEAGNSVSQTSDKGYIITGRTNSFGAGDYDVYLIRTDANGKSLWMKTFGGTGIEEGNSVQQTNDGGFIITGYTKSFGAGGVDIYLIRADANGEVIWTKTFGGKTDDYGKSVQQTADGGFIVAGYTNSFGGGVDVYLIHTDANGEVIWTNTYGEESDDFGNSVQQTIDGGYIIGGSTVRAGEVGGNTEKVKNVYLIKTDANGK